MSHHVIRMNTAGSTQAQFHSFNSSTRDSLVVRRCAQQKYNRFPGKQHNTAGVGLKRSLTTAALRLFYREYRGFHRVSVVSDLTDFPRVKRLSWWDEWDSIFSRLCNDPVLLWSQRDFLLLWEHTASSVSSTKVGLQLRLLLKYWVGERYIADYIDRNAYPIRWTSSKSENPTKTNYSSHTREQVSVMSALQHSMTPFLCHTADALVGYEGEISTTPKRNT